MKFSDALVASGKRPGFPCSLGKVEQELDAEDRDDLAAALADTENVQSSTISRALQSMGFKIAPNTVSRHRRGDCRCG